jgi:homoserine kinase
MSRHAVSSFAPATVANVGPGFDAFGFAIDGPGDVVQVVRSRVPGTRIVAIEGDGGKLPRDARKNVASAVVANMLRRAGARFGAEVTLKKGLPLGSGLGSSSASAAAAAYAANALLGDRFDDTELLSFAADGERVACGTAHADNVAPALFGGFCVVRPGTAPDVIRLAPPVGWRAVVVSPHLVLETRAARAALPKRVTLAAMASMAANAAAVIAAIYKKDLALFGRAVMAEAVAVPARLTLIKGGAAAVRAAMRAGASCTSISGAGPAIFALTDTPAHAKVVAGRMSAAWRKTGVRSDVIVSRIGADGARIIGRSE